MKKKKLVITTATVVFSLTIGTAFAFVDAGQKLQEWYDGRFQESTNTISSNVEEPINEMITELQQYGNSKINDSKSNILKQITSSINNSNNIIFSHYYDYRSQLEKKEKEISSKVSNDFDKFTEQKNNEVNSFMSTVIEKSLTEFNGELNEIVENTSSDMQNTSNQAQQEIKNSISTIKTQVSNKVKLEQEIAVSEMKENIDLNVEDSKREVQKYIEEYTDEKITTIDQEVKDIEEQAQKEMTDIILNINNK